MDVEFMVAGKQTDKLVADALGWKLTLHINSEWRSPETHGKYVSDGHGNSFSTSDAIAFETIWPVLCQRYEYVSIVSKNGGLFTIVTGKTPIIPRWMNTVALALCAALLVPVEPKP